MSFARQGHEEGQGQPTSRLLEALVAISIMKQVHFQTQNVKVRIKTLLDA